MASPKRAARQPRNSGICAEYAAVWYLRLRGYRVIGRNARTPFGEIDIIAAKKDMIAFVEVRYRSAVDFGTPLETVTRKKQDRIIKSAQYCMLGWGYPQLQMRFDVLGIYRRGWFFTIEYIANAFGKDREYV